MKTNGRKTVLGVGEMMNNEQEVCPICGSQIVEKMIDYTDWSDRHLVIVRGVPVRECQAEGHRFFQARVAYSLEQVFEADKQGQLKPVEIMEVPVVQYIAA
jgi:YgiT-type zinc finger domain-containing protein